VHDDHGEAFAPDFLRLPVAVTEHRTWAISGYGALHFNNERLRLREG
jgi:hypothetical protein